MISMSCTKTNVNQFWHDVVSIARRCGNLVIRIMVTRLVRHSCGGPNSFAFLTCWRKRKNIGCLSLGLNNDKPVRLETEKYKMALHWLYTYPDSRPQRKICILRASREQFVQVPLALRIILVYKSQFIYFGLYESIYQISNLILVMYLIRKLEYTGCETLNAN